MLVCACVCVCVCVCVHRPLQSVCECARAGVLVFGLCMRGSCRDSHTHKIYLEVRVSQTKSVMEKLLGNMLLLSRFWLSERLFVIAREGKGGFCFQCVG